MPVRSVLHVITNADLGGAQLHLAHLVEDQVASLEVTCLVGESGPACVEFEARGAKVIVLENLSRRFSPINDLRAVMEMRSHLARIQPDVLHAHSSKAGMVARLAARPRHGCLVVYTVHGWGFKNGVPIPRRQVVWAAERALKSRADAYICVSRFDAHLSRRALGLDSGRTIHVPNGIPYLPAVSRTGERNRVVMVGRFQEPKRQDIVIRAMARLPQEVSATFVGSGPGVEAMKALARSCGVLERVSFLGDRRDVAELLEVHDIGVLVSDYEGMPLSVLEYMRAGIPVVASRVGGVSEMIRNGVSGILLNRNDEQSLAEAIESLRANRTDAEHLGAEARRRFEERFDSRLMTARVRKVYEDLAMGAVKSTRAAAS